MKRSLGIVFCVIFISSLFAEGSKQLQPLPSDFGNMHIRPGDPDYTPFGLYDAPDVNSIKLTIADTSETLYFGLNNEGENNGRNFVENVEYRIVSPSGVVVYESIIPDVGQEGNIASWNQASIGPQELYGPGGYDALTLTFDEVGDYKIEFDPPGNTFTDIHLFDFTVVDSLGQVRPGRLHSQGWQITAESFDNPFNAVMYPYHPDGVVYEVDFNGIRPYLFVINFNSTGTDSSGNFFVDRMSQNYNRTYPEFEVFLSPPDELLYPRFKRELTFNASITNKNCDSTEICLSFETNAPGEVEGFIDFNGNGIYDEDSGELYFGDNASGSEQTCISWDGRDADGNRIDQRQMQMISSFGYGVMHLPIYDAENHENGYIVRVHSPDGLRDPIMHWDDYNIRNKGNAVDGISNISGCENPGGCHRWRNRGRDNNFSETINTWWYSEVMYDTLVFQNLWNRPVRLSFDPDSLDQEPKVICEGDSLPFYVFNDIAHFDTTFFTYEWLVNGQKAPENDINEIIRQVNGSINIGVIAREKEAQACTSRDDLEVTTVPPVEINAVIVDVSCTVDQNSISVNVTNGPPNPQITWEDFPDDPSFTVAGIDRGVYRFHIADPDFSESCALDSAFEVEGYEGIAIEELILQNTFCYAAAGEAEVIMRDPEKTYQYSWNNAAFTSNNMATGLLATGQYLRVQEPSTGCEVDTTFQITGDTFDFTLSSTNEVCENGTGTISLELPDEGEFNIYLNGTLRNQRVFENLSAGAYTVRVTSAIPGCEDQEIGIVSNIDSSIYIDELIITPTECYAPTGTAAVSMVDVNRNYTFTWDGVQPGGKVQQKQNLPAGSHYIHVIDESTTCETDSIFIIPELPLVVNVTTEDELCGDATGRIALDFPQGNFNVTWNNLPGFRALNNLPQGEYNVSVVSVYNSSCRYDATIPIDNIIRTIPLQSISSSPSDCGVPSGTADFLVSNNGRTYQYSWQAQPFSSRHAFNQLAVGQYIMRIREAGTNCFLDTSVNIPGAGFSYVAVPTNEFCDNSNGTINVNVTDPQVRISWFDGGTKFQRSNLRDGDYTFRLTNPNDPSCEAVEVVSINDQQSDLTADFTYYSLVSNTADVEVDDVIQFIDGSRGLITSYNWNFGDGQSSIYPNPEHSYPIEGAFNVTLAVQDVYGCVDAVTKPIPVNKKTPCGPAIPNAFSPNGDLFNDDIGMLGTAFNVDLRIYNRWGELVYRGYNVNDRWDGSYRGNDAPVGAYPFILEYTCPNNRGQQIKEKKVGDISLIR